MKIKKIQFASVAVSENMEVRVAIYVFDENNKRYLLINRWYENGIENLADFDLVRDSVDTETFIKITDYMNEICNSVTKSLENVI